MTSTAGSDSEDLEMNLDSFVAVSMPNESLNKDDVEESIQIKKSEDVNDAEEENSDASQDKKSSNIESELENRLKNCKTKLLEEIAMIDCVITEIKDSSSKTTGNYCHSCRKTHSSCSCHFIPNLDDKIRYFEGYEYRYTANKWLRSIEKLKQMEGWTDEFTLEVAQYYLLGEAMVWLEQAKNMITTWKRFKEEFTKTFIDKYNHEQLSIEKFGYFFGYREVLPVEILYRQVPSAKATEEPENYFKRFQTKKETKVTQEQKEDGIGELYDIPDNRINLYLVIKTPRVKVRHISVTKLKAVVADLNDSKTNPTKSYFEVPDSFESKGRGPFAKLPKPQNKPLIEQILNESYHYKWSEWWLHLRLEDKITSKKGNWQNLKHVLINKKRVGALIDFSAKRCTMKESVAIREGFEVIPEAKEMKTYNRTQRVTAIGYIRGKIGINPHGIRGTADVWVIPDDSQSEEVVLGRSLAKNTLVYRDNGRGGFSRWLGDMDMEDCVVLSDYAECETAASCNHVYDDDDRV